MLPDKDKTKEQLLNEMKEIRQRVTELESLEGERKQAEEVLRESEEKYKDLVSNSNDIISTADDSGNWTFLSPSVTAILGYEPEEMIGKSAFDFMLPDDIISTREAHESIVREGRHVWQFENRYIAKDGRVVTLAWNVVALRNESGNITGTQGVGRDITERKQAEKALRESETKYRGLITNVKLGIFRSTPEPSGRFLEVNSALEEITGYSRKELLQMNVSDLYVNPQERELLLEEIASNKAKAIKEVHLRKKDGTEIVVSDRKVAVRDDTGKILYFDGILEDITERKQAEEEIRNLAKFPSENPNPVLRVAKDGTILYANEASLPLLNIWGSQVGQLLPEHMLKLLSDVFDSGANRTTEMEYDDRVLALIIAPIVEASYANLYGLDITERRQAEEREKELQRELGVSRRLAAVGELAAGVAHEINNPLTGVLGFSERLLRKSTDEEIRLDLERIHDEAQRITKVMDNLRTFTRRREPEKEYSDINDILAKALELRGYELRTGNIEVVTDLARSLPEIEVDLHQIQEVFLNIILNAEQVMTEAQGRGKLTIKTGKIKNHVRISFTDDGPGISAEHLDRLFDPFFTTRGEQGGTGLGLSVCHGIVTEHGGRLRVKSKPGEGAIFFVELPCS